PVVIRAWRICEPTCRQLAGQAENALPPRTKSRGHKPHGIVAPMRLECSGYGENCISGCGRNGYRFEISDRNSGQAFVRGLRPLSRLERSAATKLESAHGGSRNN